MSEEQQSYSEKWCQEHPDENWKHRSADMLCNTCMYWVIKSNLEARRLLGRCRRRAPTLNGWPATWADDWCGDHKLDETKI